MDITASNAIQLLSFAARNKDELGRILVNLNPADPTSGTISITESLANNGIAELLKTARSRSDMPAVPFESVSLQFQDGLVIAKMQVSAEKKLPILGLQPSLTFNLRIRQIHFNEHKHKILFSLENGFALRHIVNAAIARIDAFSLENDCIVLDIDRTKAAEQIPPWLSFVFLSCADGHLNLAYEIKE